MSSSATVNSPLVANKSDVDFSKTPTYLQFILGSVQYFSDSINELKTYSYNDFQKDLKLCTDRITITDILLVLFLTIVWTFARFLATKYVFRPIASYYQLTKSDANKMPESAWKFLFYLSTWSSMAYILLIEKRSSYFLNPTTVWQNYSIDNPIEKEIYAIYLIQLSFYCHSLYSTLRIDQWRKDSPTLMVHHILCVLLISISLATKTHKSGLLAMFLHDGCDILLEGTKMTRYFKVQNGKVIKNMDLITNTGFGCFIFVWLFCRLYCYPLKQLYVASVYVSAQQIKVPFILPINIMLWILLLMNVYWFTFIIKLLYKVITGQMKELDDNREYSDHNCDHSLDQLNKDEANDVNNDETNGRYYLRQRKINYNLLHTGRSQ